MHALARARQMGPQCTPGQTCAPAPTATAPHLCCHLRHQALLEDGPVQDGQVRPARVRIQGASALARPSAGTGPPQLLQPGGAAIAGDVGPRQAPCLSLEPCRCVGKRRCVQGWQGGGRCRLGVVGGRGEEGVLAVALRHVHPHDLGLQRAASAPDARCAAGVHALLHVLHQHRALAQGLACTRGVGSGGWVAHRRLQIGPESGPPSRQPTRRRDKGAARSRPIPGSPASTNLAHSSKLMSPTPSPGGRARDVPGNLLLRRLWPRTPLGPAASPSFRPVASSTSSTVLLPLLLLPLLLLATARAALLSA